MCKYNNEPTMSSIFNRNDLSNLMCSDEELFPVLPSGHQDPSATPRHFPIVSTDMYTTTQPHNPVFVASPSSSHYSMPYNVNSSPHMQLSSAPMNYDLSVGSHNGYHGMDNTSLAMSRSTSNHSTHSIQSIQSSIQSSMFSPARHSVNSLINYDSNPGFTPMTSSMPLSMPAAAYGINTTAQYSVGPMGHPVPAVSSMQNQVYDMPAMSSAVRQDCSSPSSWERGSSESNDKKQIYSCTYSTCNLRFNTTSELQVHKKEAHRNGNQRPEVNQKGPFYCRRINPTTKLPCDTSFNRPYDLTRHEHSTHGKGEKFACDICPDRLFSRADALTRHYSHVHHQTARPKDLAKRARRVVSRESLKGGRSRSRRSSAPHVVSPVAITQQEQQQHQQAMAYSTGHLLNLRPMPMASMMNTTQDPSSQYTTCANL